VTLRACSRHPGAGEVAGHCAACLLDSALADAGGDAAAGHGFTIQVPLGESEAGPVFLVRGESPRPRLLRLKRWRTPAPAGFIERFVDLQAQLEGWGEPAIVMPVGAWIEAAGCPAALTEFRQGMPLLDSVRSGRLPADLAIAGLRHLHQVLSAAHARGLAHGSLRPGNVFAARPDGAPYLLDFGFAGLLSPGSAVSSTPASDLKGLASIEAAVRASTASISHPV
jgi:serine/threonine protein kinase